MVCRTNDTHLCETLESLSTEAAPEFTNWHWDPARRGQDNCPVVASGKTKSDGPAESRRPGTSGPADGLTVAACRYLRTVIEHPGKPSSALAKLAGIGTHQALALRRELVRCGYLREHRVNTGRRGRASIVLEPLPAALTAVGLDKESS